MPSTKLLNFRTIGLNQAETDPLQNRTETKFLLNTSQLDGILDQITGAYTLLEINTLIAQQYVSLYFDTPDLLLYHMHHAGKSKRYKIRQRKYLSTGNTFLEIKHNTNKNRSIKKRLAIAEVAENWTDEQSRFLMEQQSILPYNLKPVIKVVYERVTIVNNSGTERVTIDSHLHFSSGTNSASLERLIIAEVKQTVTNHSEFVRALKKHAIHPIALSKYCLGMALTHKRLKKNNFKALLLTINKLIK